jgi:hypothetical protein
MEEEAWVRRDTPKVFLGPPARNLTAEAFLFLILHSLLFYGSLWAYVV